MENFPAYLAEFISTFALIFIGAGSILANGLTGGALGLTGIALAHGLVLFVMIYAIGHISGGHVNPAVTIGMWVTKRIGTVKAVGYIISQLAGAILGGFLLKLVFVGADASLNLGTPALGPGVSFGTAILVELILTFFLMFVIYGVAIDKRAPAGVYGAAIGLTVAVDILAGGPLTGAAMNPARSLGPALAQGFFANHAVYWIGPILGSILAAVVYNTFLLKEDK